MRVDDHYGEVGTTSDPFREGHRIPGEEAPIGRHTLQPPAEMDGARDLLPLSETRCIQINAGRPDWKGVWMINRLVRRKWCDIGSEIGYDVADDKGWVTTQVYPTYTLYLYDGTRFEKQGDLMDSKSPFRNFRDKRQDPPEFVGKRT